MKISLSKTLRLIVALVATILIGCESADVETGTTTTTGNSSSNGTNDDTPSDGNQSNGSTNYKTLAVAPSSGVHTTIGNFTILEISQLAGYTYVWSLSNPSLGTLSPQQGTKVTYMTTSIPSTGSAVQTITVIGTKAGSSVKYRGISTITHQAP